MQLSQQVFEFLSTPCKKYACISRTVTEGRIAYLKCVSSYERASNFKW